MKRNYIGLACTGHDNAIAIVNANGELIFAESTERHMQIKRAINCPPDNPIHLIQTILDQYCDKDADIVIAKSWSEKLSQIFQQEGQLVNERKNHLAQSPVSHLLTPDLDTYQYVIDFALNNVKNSGIHLDFFCKLALGKTPINKAYNHHLTHAAAGCYTSSFDEAACMIVDGFGEGVSISYYRYAEGKLTELESVKVNGDMTQSLGVFYGNLCGWCGFDVWKGEEWKVMGLAPYGKFNQQIYDLMRQRIQNYGLQIECPESGYESLGELLQYVRQPGSDPLTVADLAYTGQKVFCDIMTDLINNFYEMGISENLVIGGGCGLNSAYNGQIISATRFKQLHIFSAPADDGNAVGAAFLAYHEDHPQKSFSAKLQLPYLGSVMSEETIKNVEQFGRIPGMAHLPGKICQKTAELLAQGKIIGWVQGRAEFGPRALGNRSILADPRSPKMKDKINASVKFREEFRPFAPSILHEFGDEYFLNYQESPYMERTLLFRPEMRELVSAVVHEDGTGRLQTVKREWNERYFDLINAFYQLTGVPILLNTSLNVMGKPIVHSVEDVLAVFYTSGLDALIVNDYIIEKV